MLIDPGIDRVSFSITSTRPKRCSRLAMTLAAWALYVVKDTESCAVPKPELFGGGLFVATAEPTIVAATATVTRARIRNC